MHRPAAYFDFRAPVAQGGCSLRPPALPYCLAQPLSAALLSGLAPATRHFLDRQTWSTK